MTPQPTWRSLLQMSRFAGGYSVAHAVLWGLLNLSALLPGLIARSFFDALTGSAAIPVGTSGLVLALAVLALAQAALWLIAGSVEITFRFLVSALLRRNLLGLLLDRPGALAPPSSIGETISRFRDDVDVAEDSLDWTDEIAGQGAIALVALAVLLATDAGLTLAVVVPLVLVIAAAQRSVAALGRYREASSQAAGQVAGAIGDMLMAVETVRAAGAEERIVAHLRRLNRRRQTLTIKDRLATQMLEAVTVNLAGIGTGLIMLLAAGRLREGSLTVGDFVLFVSYLAVVTDYIAQLGRYLAQFRQTGVAFRRLHALTDAAPATALAAPAPLHLRGPLPAAAAPIAPRPEPLRLATATALPTATPTPGGGSSMWTCAWPAARSPSSPAASAPGRRLCCGPSSACSREHPARSGGTGPSSRIRRPSWRRPGRRTRRRSPASSATRSGGTCCSACPTTPRWCRTRSAARCWNATSRPSRRGWRPPSAAAA